MSAEGIEACASCRFFMPGQRVSAEAHDGSCHYGPPANYSTPSPQELDEPIEERYEHDSEPLLTIGFMSDNTYTGWPIVRQSDWCGTYEAVASGDAA